MAINETKIITKSADDNGFYTKRERAQKITFDKLNEIIQRNITKTSNKSYTQYSKDLLRTYSLNPASNLANLREISRFVCRNSMLYKKLLMYYAAMPLYYYNITPINDLSKSLNGNKIAKDYYSVVEKVEKIDIAKEMYNAVYLALRDGFYVGYSFADDSTGDMFLMPLDVDFLRVYGKTISGEWIVYMDASFFDKDSNKDYIYGVNNDGIGVWDTDIFLTGYETYKNQGRDFQWFRLPPEKTFCLLAGSDDEFTTPLPFFLQLLQSLLDLLDLESLINSKTELENYKLLISKIPLINGSDSVDDFAISLELAQMFDNLLEGVLPELIGHITTPLDITAETFEKSNNSNDTDQLSVAMNNLFNNAGASQLVVAGGSSTNAIGLKHNIQNDMSTTWVWVDRVESWLNYYIQMNISEGYKLQIHKITWYNKEDYQTSMKDVATLGGSALDMLTSYGDTPYMAFQKLNFENALGIKDLMRPLQSSYTQSGSTEGGAPKKDEDDLSVEGANTRAGDKNGSENI